ncbi:unnamed protein product [Lota lota]
MRNTRAPPRVKCRGSTSRPELHHCGGQGIRRREHPDTKPPMLGCEAHGGWAGRCVGVPTATGAPGASTDDDTGPGATVGELMMLQEPNTEDVSRRTCDRHTARSLGYKHNHDKTRE